MPSLLFITQQYPINRDSKGDDVFIKNEVPYLSKKFDKIHILCLDSCNTNDILLETPENVLVYFAKKKCKKIKKIFLLFILPFTLLFYNELFSLFKKRKLSIRSMLLAVSFLLEALVLRMYIKQIIKCDVSIRLIYTYWYTAETMAALLQKRYYSIPCVTRTHGADLYEFRNQQRYQPYKAWMDANIDHVFFISQHGYDYYLDTFAGGDSKKYSIARLGIPNTYTIEEKGSNQLSFFLLSCSNIVPVKRVHLIVQALGEINDCVIHWTHIGGGSEKNVIVSMADELLHNKKNISYEFKGFMTNNQVMQFYSEQYFDCFISTSESEGLPVSMMEAISFGIPIIATNVGGVPELVNNDTGMLLKPDGNISEIKQAIINFYNFSQDKKSAMRQSARLLWESGFNAEVNHARFSEKLFSIAEGNH